jgi:hypothetical protein
MASNFLVETVEFAASSDSTLKLGIEARFTKTYFPAGQLAVA